MSPQEMIYVIKAHKDGEQVQFLHKTEKPSSDNYWINAKTPVWNFATCNYRIVPKAPKTMHQYLLYNTRDNKYICTSALYSSMEDALEDYKSSYWTIIKRLDHTEITITE